MWMPLRACVSRIFFVLTRRRLDEDAQLEMVVFETQATVQVARDEVQQLMDDAMEEVERLRQMAMGNVTRWKKTLQELKDATRKNHEMLQEIESERAEVARLETAVAAQKTQKEKSSEEAVRPSTKTQPKVAQSDRVDGSVRSYRSTPTASRIAVSSTATSSTLSTLPRKAAR